MPGNSLREMRASNKASFRVAQAKPVVQEVVEEVAKDTKKSKKEKAEAEE